MFVSDRIIIPCQSLKLRHVDNFLRVRLKSKKKTAEKLFPPDNYTYYFDKSSLRMLQKVMCRASSIATLYPDDQRIVDYFPLTTLLVKTPWWFAYLCLQSRSNHTNWWNYYQKQRLTPILIFWKRLVHLISRTAGEKRTCNDHSFTITDEKHDKQTMSNSKNNVERTTRLSRVSKIRSIKHAISNKIYQAKSTSCFINSEPCGEIIIRTMSIGS